MRVSVLKHKYCALKFKLKVVKGTIAVVTANVLAFTYICGYIKQTHTRMFTHMHVHTLACNWWAFCFLLFMRAYESIKCANKHTNKPNTDTKFAKSANVV